MGVPHCHSCLLCHWDGAGPAGINSSTGPHCFASVCHPIPVDLYLSGPVSKMLVSLRTTETPRRLAPHGGNLLRYWLIGIHNKTFCHVFLHDLLLGKRVLKGVCFCFCFVFPSFISGTEGWTWLCIFQESTLSLRLVTFWNMISLSCPGSPGTCNLPISVVSILTPVY